MMTQRKKKQTNRLTKTSKTASKLSVREHLLELRKRATICALVVIAGASLAYGFQQQIIDLLLVPSGDQEFIYTSPMGGVNFLFGISLRLGIILATPIIVYHALVFLSPLMKHVTRRFTIWMSLAMFVVAIVGILFGYYLGLPSALYFLFHQFQSIQIKPLITIQSYMSFVSLYLFGSALMFQLPFIIIIINRIKPLTPSMLLKYERHLIVGTLLVAFMMNPSPNILDQLFVIIPIILMYQVSIVMIWYMARKQRRQRSRIKAAHFVYNTATAPKQQLSPLLAPGHSTPTRPKSYTDPMMRPVSRQPGTRMQTPHTRVIATKSQPAPVRRTKRYADPMMRPVSQATAVHRPAPAAQRLVQ